LIAARVVADQVCVVDALAYLVPPRSGEISYAIIDINDRNGR